VAEQTADKYLTFRLGCEEYGVDILQVREIVGLMPITPVPRTQGCIRGVVNLRGKIIPVLDLRAKFDMGRVEDTEVSCIVVVDTLQRGNTVLMGLLVDTVSEVIDIPEAEIESATCFGNALDAHFIHGLAKHRSGVKILLNIEAVLAEPGLIEIAMVADELANAGESLNEEGKQC
jgi:purine-binding chemotaxis protein CheW